MEEDSEVKKVEVVSQYDVDLKVDKHRCIDDFQSKQFGYNPCRTYP